MPPHFRDFWGRPSTEYLTGHRGTTVSSCCGHGLPAYCHFRRPCPDFMTGNRRTSLYSFRGRGRLPQKSQNFGGILLPSLFIPSLT